MSRRSVRDGTARHWVGSRWFRAIQWLAGLAIVVFAARSLARNWEALALMVAGALIGVGLLLWPPLLRRLLGFAAPDSVADSVADRAPSARGIVFGIFANLIAWVGYGTALWLLARGLLPGVRLAWL